MCDKLELIESIKVLSLNKNDILVFKIGEPIDDYSYDVLKGEIKEILVKSGNEYIEIMLIDSTINIEILRNNV